MAEELPPGTPEVDDPLLVADLIQLLSIKGAIGRLPLADIVIPVVSLGDVVTPDFNVRGPVFRSADVFSAGVLTASAAGTVLADTTALPAGEYDLQYWIQSSDSIGDKTIAFEHRDAANAANLAIWSFTLTGDGFQQVMKGPFTLSYELAVNERLRIVVGAVAIQAGVPSVATIFARLRT